MTTAAPPSPPTTAFRREHVPWLLALPIALFIWVLPFHAVVIAFFFGVLRTGMKATMVMAAWKEGIAVILLLAVTLRCFLSRGPRVWIAAPDVAITTLIAVAALFALVENPIFGAEVPANVAVFGFRSSVFFMTLYYVGRATPELGDNSIYLKHLFRVAVVVAFIAIVERIFITPRMLVALGAASYTTDFLGMTASTGGNEFGLPANYFSVLGRTVVRRAGSVFLGGQAFAIPFLLFVPAATAWVFAPEKRLRAVSVIGYAVMWVGLLLTITRTTIIVCTMQVILYFMITRKPTRAAGTVMTAALLLLLALLVVPGLASFLVQTAAFQTSSSYSHVADWRRGTVAFFERPWGHGLGSSDQVAVRFGRKAVTADNMFLGYAVDLGALGLIAYLAVIVTLAFLAWRLFRTSENNATRSVAAVVLLTNLGIALNGTSSSPFNSVFLAYNFFLLAGSAVTAYQRQSSPSALRV